MCPDFITVSVTEERHACIGLSLSILSLQVLNHELDYCPKCGEKCHFVQEFTDIYRTWDTIHVLSKYC